MLFLQIAGAKVRKNYELRIINYELFRIFALIFNDLYEIRRLFPHHFGRFGSRGAVSVAPHHRQRLPACVPPYYYNRCLPHGLGNEAREPLLIVGHASKRDNDVTLVKNSILAARKHTVYPSQGCCLLLSFLRINLRR